MTLTYTQQIITLLSSEDRPVTVEATVAVGTGLAYHGDISGEPVYVLTHVNSGYRVSDLSMQTEAEIQAWLSRVADLDPDRWNSDLSTLRKRYQGDQQIHAKLALAHEQTCMRERQGSLL